MFQAQILNGGDKVYSPWMARGGDALRATLEVVAVSGATIKIELWTKNSDEAGDGDDADSANGVNIEESTVGRKTEDWNKQVTSTVGIKELVRYKITVSGTSGDWVLFRMLDPVWYDNVKT